MLHGRGLQPRSLPCAYSITQIHLHPLAEVVATYSWLFQASDFLIIPSTFRLSPLGRHHGLTQALSPSSRDAICHQGLPGYNGGTKTRRAAFAYICSFHGF